LEGPTKDFVPCIVMLGTNKGVMSTSLYFSVYQIPNRAGMEYFWAIDFGKTKMKSY